MNNFDLLTILDDFACMPTESLLLELSDSYDGYSNLYDFCQELDSRGIALVASVALRFIK